MKARSGRPELSRPNMFDAERTSTGVGRASLATILEKHSKTIKAKPS
jgi:hypothetical protein